MPLFNRPPKSLCILRLSAVGDVCHALAAVQQIQRHWSETKVSWIIGKTEYQLVKGLSDINFIIYDKKAGWKGIWAVWKQLKNQSFDALLNMQTAFRASILSLGIQAKYKIGFGQKRSREGQWLFVNLRVNDPINPHVLDGFMAFVDYLGVPVSSPQWQLPISEQDSQMTKQFLDQNRKNVVIAPCSSKVEKDWLAERYAKVANWLNQQHIQVIFCCSPSARELNFLQQILSFCDFQPINAGGKTSLTQLAALIGQADFVISPDSGSAHIATIMNTSVIGLYAYHNPLRTAPYNDLDNVVSVYEQNALKEFGKPSSQLPWATKLKGKNLMAEISVQEVLNKIKKLGLDCSSLVEDQYSKGKN